MLILTRRPGETFYIGQGPNPIKVTLLGVKGNQARIGIDAPREIEVHREEIYERIHGTQDGGDTVPPALPEASEEEG